MADDDTLRDLGTNAAPGEIPKWDGTQWRNAHDNITTVNAGAGLSGTMTNGEITVAVTFGGQRTNNLVAAFTDMDTTRPPVGAIVAWAKNLTGVSTNLPTGWVECNGQTLNDTNSPLHGTTIPNLNGASGLTQRFLRGSQSSGATGGSESHSHGISNGNETRGDNAGMRMYAKGTSSDGSSTLPSYYEVIWILRVK
jgi:hypothetical protein